MANQDLPTDRDIDQQLDRDIDRDPLSGKVDTGREAPGADAGTGAGDGASAPLGVGGERGRPDVERDQSGLGSASPSGRSGLSGSEPGQAEAGTLGFGETGELGSGGATDPQWQQGQTSWQEQAAGQAGGAQGQGAVGGETWAGRDRDTGMGGWTQDDSGRTVGSEGIDAERSEGDEAAGVDGESMPPGPDTSQRTPLG